MKFIQTTALLAAFALLTSCATTPKTSSDSLEPETVSGEVRLTVFGLSCPLCASNLTDALNRVDGVTESWGNLDTGMIHLLVAEGREIPSSALRRAVQDAGFTLQSIHRAETP